MQHGERINKYISSIADGFVFSLLASLLCYAFLYCFLGINAEALPLVLLVNLIIWIFIGIVGAEKVVQGVAFAVSIIVLIILYINSDAEVIQQNISGYITWLNNTFATPDVYYHEEYGVYFRTTIFGAITFILLPFFDLKNSPKFSAMLWLLIVAAFFGFSYFYFNKDLTILFILTIPILFYIYSRACYYKNKKLNNKQDGYFIFQFKRFMLCCLPTTILCIIILIFPVNLRSEKVVDFINTTSDTVVKNVEVLNRLSSRYHAVENDVQLLGGDLTQGATVRFSVKSDHSLLLRTNIYDKYTGAEFIKTQDNMIFEYKPQQPKANRSGFIADSSSYTINMIYYNSRILPLVCGYKSIDADAEDLSVNNYDMVYYDHYFIENDEFVVEYDVMSEGLFDFFRVIHDGFISDDQVPIEALGELPDTVTERTVRLANMLREYSRELISFIEERRFSYSEEEKEAISNYYLVLLLENYLSNSYRYSTTPGEIIGDDFVDSFLFETKEGYCTSFAAALYVLLRAADVPCRYVSGYSVQNVNGDEFVKVSDENLHAWVEVYIKGYGYVTVDPTPAAYYGSDSSPVSNTNNYQPTDTEIIEGIIEEEQSAPEETETDDEENILQTTDMQKSKSNYALVIAWAILFLVVLAVIAFSPIWFIKYKKSVVERVLQSKDFYVVYRNLINLLSLIGYKQRKNESLREFMLRVYELYNPFRVNETIIANSCSDFNTNLSNEMEEVIKTIEAFHYSENSESIDITTLVAFRDNINRLVVRTRSPIIYLLTFKNVK